MSSKTKAPACFYHPITVLFLDDNKNFLETLEIDLEGCGSMRMFTNADEALHAISSSEENINKDILKIIDKGEAAEESGHLVNVAINDIYKLIYDSSRFNYIAIIVVDYKMPQQNGVDFCASIKNQHVLKIMLTAEADQQVAIDAFNSGVINKFLPKRSDDLKGLLIQAIEELKTLYFRKLSATIFESLPSVSKDLINSKKYQLAFEETKVSSNAVEYYMIDDSGSFLFLDEAGRPTWFVVKSHTELKEQYELAEGLGVPENILEPLKSGGNLLFMLSISDERQPPEAWGDYVFPATPLDDEHSYAVISDKTKNEVNWDKVSPYKV